MSKKSTSKENELQLGIIYPNSAAIDVGSMNMMVSYLDANGIQVVKEYFAYTEELLAMAKELKSAGVIQVGMEATGVYWMSVYEILEQNGFHVTLVNARHYKNVSAQKTDVKDCQWLHQLHAHALLRPSHIAGEQYRELRTYIHERELFQKQKSDTLNRIHKVLTQMNIKVQHVISDIEGVIGMKIITRISQGAQTPGAILEGLDIGKLKASEEELNKSLQGIFKPHFIKVLKMHLDSLHFYKQQMLSYEGEIENLLKKMLPERDMKETIKPKATKARKNQYHFNLKEYLHRIVGVDLTEIDGLEEHTILTVIAVVGLNLDKWPTAGHFVSWLNLAARPKITGGKVIGHQKRFTNNPATQAFRMGAQTMWQNKGPLGQLYRRLAHTKGSKKAIKAVARRLAVIFYTMVKKQASYDPKIVALDEEKIKARKIARLQKEAEKLGCKLEVKAA
jgi:transposase